MPHEQNVERVSVDFNQLSKRYQHHGIRQGGAVILRRVD
jgi:hypothetical protein